MNREQDPGFVNSDNSYKPDESECQAKGYWYEVNPNL
jgi:hypothetical protein